MNIFQRLFSKAEPVETVPPKTRHVRAQWGAAAHNPLVFDWVAQIEAPDQETLRDTYTLRGRSRKLCKDNPYAARYLELCAVNVIGPHGIQLQSRNLDAVQELDAKVNGLIERGFSAWGEAATLDGTMTWLDVEQLCMKTVAQDGEIFVRMVNEAKNEWGFALTLIDADYLDLTYSRNPSKGQNEIRQGIERDQYGIPVAYHFWTSHPSEGRNAPKRLRIPAEEIIHLYRPLRPGQTRGVPWLAPAMIPLHHLGEYMIAEVIAARTGASKMGFVTTNPTDGSPWEDENGAWLPNEIEANPGTITRLGPGEAFQSWNPDHPTGNFDSFTKTLLRAIASALNVSYGALTYDMSQDSYSSGRIGTQQERDYWRLIGQWMIRTLHKRVFESWLTLALANGSLGLEGDVKKYLNYQFRQRGWPYANPQQEMTAYQTGISLGLTSRTKIAAENGMDIREIFAELREEMKLAEENGINVSGAKVTEKSNPPVEDPPPKPVKPNKDAEETTNDTLEEG